MLNGCIMGIYPKCVFMSVRRSMVYMVGVNLFVKFVVEIISVEAI